MSRLGQRCVLGLWFGLGVGVAGCDAGEGPSEVPGLAAPGEGALDVAADAPRASRFGVGSSFAPRTLPRAPARPVLPTHVSRGERADAPGNVTVADDIGLGAVIDGALDALDNLSCEQALPLPDAGAVRVPGTGGQLPGCSTSSLSQRFFSVTARPGELVTVRFDSDAADGMLWLAAGPSCALDAGACFHDWAWSRGGIVLAGGHDAPVSHVVSVIADRGAADHTYGLTVERTRAAPNGTCEDARPLVVGTTRHDFTGAGVEPPTAMFRRALHYTIEIPPMTRARVGLTSEAGLFAYLRRDCAEDFNFASDELSNTGDTPLLAQLVVGSGQHLAAGPFELTLTLSPLAPEAACDNPVELAVGARAVLDVEGGGDGPASCWCFRVTRGLHAAVSVPAGGVVEVVGDAASGATLIELPDECAAECGSNAAFGWAGGPARLGLVNDSDRDAVRHVLVTSNAEWHEDGTTSSPPVTLEVRGPSSER